eukprot:COSAG02_NODE_40716_length_402_cov_0.848185_1_plen_133_part_11
MHVRIGARARPPAPPRRVRPARQCVLVSREHEPPRGTMARHGLVLQHIARSLGVPAVRRLAVARCSPHPQYMPLARSATSSATTDKCHRLKLPSPKQLLEALPLNTHAAATVHGTREAIRNVLTGQSDRLIVI